MRHLYRKEMIRFMGFGRIGVNRELVCRQNGRMVILFQHRDAEGTEVSGRIFIGLAGYTFGRVLHSSGLRVKKNFALTDQTEGTQCQLKSGRAI